MEYFVDDPHGVAGWAESLSPLHIAWRVFAYWNPRH